MKKNEVKIGGVYLAKVTNKLVSVRINGESRFGGWDAESLATGKTVRIKGAGRLRGEVKTIHRRINGLDITTTFPPEPTNTGAEQPSSEPQADATVPNHVAQDEQQPPIVGQGEDEMSKKAKEPMASAAKVAMDAGKPGRRISCSKCGRVIELPRKEKGTGCHGRCECGQHWTLGARLVKLSGQAKYLNDIPAATTITAPPPSTKAEKKAADKKEKTPKAAGKMSGLDAAAKVLADAGKPMGIKVLVEKMLNDGLWTTGGATPASTIYAAIIREIKVKGADSRFKKSGRGEFELASK